MKKEKTSYRFGLIVLLIVIAALSRMFPHPMNFTPVGAIALFGAAYVSRKWLAVVIPLASVFLSDVLINNTIYAHYYNKFTLFYPGFYFTYGAFVLIAILGFVLLRKVSTINVLVSSLLAAIVFFLVSNLGAWIGFHTYPHTSAGLLACYVAGLPFFKYTLLSSVFYSALLFGVFELAQRNIPAFQLKAE